MNNLLVPRFRMHFTALRRPASVLAALVLAQTLTSFPAQASVITVAPSAATGSSAGCSLTDAVLAANASTDATAGNVTVGACTPTGTPGGGGSGYSSGNVIVLATGGYIFTAANNYWYGPNALPPIASNIVIVGAAGGSVIERSTASGTPAFRLFYVGGGESLASYNAANVTSGKLPGPGQLTLVNLTVENGLAKGDDSYYGGGGLGAGGAIYNQGTLTLNGATLRGNEALGGSINSSANIAGGGMGGTTTSSYARGGGFTAAPWPSSSAASGTFGNGGSDGASCSTSYCSSGSGQAGGVGGGGGSGGSVPSSDVYAGAGGAGGYGGGGGDGGSGAGPSANGGFGGGGSACGGSSCGLGGYGGGTGGGGGGGGGGGLGGAVFNEGGTVTSLNSTLSTNTAQGGYSSAAITGSDGLGGALFNLNGTVVLRYTTLADNTVAGGNGSSGGAVYNLYKFKPGSPAADASSSATMTVNSSILSGSTNGGGTSQSDCENNAGTFNSGYDVVQTKGSCTFANNDQNTTPQLATAAATANGGPTPTLALKSTSPAINHGDTGTTLGPVPGTDQRGYPRDSQPDVGSYEYIAPPTVAGLPATLTVDLGNPVPGQSFTLTGKAPLTVTPASSNATLLPASGITLGSGCGTDTSHYSCTLAMAPASGATGSATVTVTAADNYGGSGSQSLTLTVQAVPHVGLSPAPLAFGSVAAGNTKTLNETLTNTGTATLSIAGIAIGGTNASQFSQTNACPGSLTAGANCAVQVSYTPNALASASAKLTITSNASSSPDSVLLSGTGTDTAPTASNGTLRTSTDTSGSGTLSATNPDSGQTLTFSIVTPPSHGTVAITNATTGAYTYTSASGYVGSDSFTFKANDGYKDSNIATVSVSVTDTPPVAQGASYNVTANHYLSGTLKATASSPSLTLTYAIVSKPAHGSVSLDASTGQFTYIPTHDYTGTDSFTFKASDGTLDSNTATITLKVAAGALAAHNGAGGGAFGPWGLALLAGLVLLLALFRKKPASRNMRVTALALGMFLTGSVLFTATPARAAATGPWYLGIQGNVLKAASGRNSATAGFKGLTLLFGRHLGDHFALEIDRASYSDSPETLTATANWVNWGLRGLYFPWKSEGAFAPFVFAGVGHQYEYRGDNSELSNNSASLGLGFTSQPWSAPVAIRADIEAQHGFGGGYNDKIFSLGVVFGFSTSD